jgi:2-phosphoglycolate phosphatase
LSFPQVLDPDRILGLVLDLDGTLVDSYSAIASAVNHARAAFDLAPLPPDDVRARVGHGLESLMRDVVGEGNVEQGVRLFRERYASVFAAETLPLPGAVEVLEELRTRGYRLSVASNKPSYFGEPILERLGMLPYLDSVQGPDRVGSAKPDPAMVQACLRSMGIAADRAAYVGDMVLDVETAAKARIPVVLVPGGSSPRADLRDTGELVLSGLFELLTLLPEKPGPP